MLSTLLPVLAASAALAAPVIPRQFGGGFGGGSTTENELSNGMCGQVILIYARASTETGNMGSSLGPPLCSDLKSHYGSTTAICQGVGGPYDASLEDNALPQGTSQAAIDEATRLFTLAHTQCPNAAVVAGGYSQGTAVMTASISGLSSDIQNQVKGAVLFGDTRNEQTGGSIPNYPKQNVMVYCNADDGVCGGSLTVTAGHFEYSGDVAPAAQFLEQRVSAA